MMNTLLCHRMLLVRLLVSYELNVGALTTRVLTFQTLIGQILKSDLDPDQSRTQLNCSLNRTDKSEIWVQDTTNNDMKLKATFTKPTNVLRVEMTPGK